MENQAVEIVDFKNAKTEKQNEYHQDVAKCEKMWSRRLTNFNVQIYKHTNTNTQHLILKHH